MKSYIYFLLFTITCYSQLNLRSHNFTYDKDIAKFKNVRIALSVKNLNFDKLNNSLSIHDYNEPKKVDKISIDNSIFQPDKKQSGFNSMNEFDDAFIYGSRNIYDDKLFLYSESYKNKNDDLNELKFYLSGVLLITNKNKITSWVSVSHTEVQGEYIKRSFLSDNYVIVIEITNEDVATNLELKPNLVRYCIFKIHKNGFLERLKKLKSRKILEIWFKKNKH